MDAVHAEPEMQVDSADEGADAPDDNTPAHTAPAAGASAGSEGLADAQDLDAMDDPLTNRLEVADAEDAGVLQASRDQPSQALAMADPDTPAAAASAAQNAAATISKGRKSGCHENQKAASPSRGFQKLGKKVRDRATSEPSMTIPPDSEATPAGVPQPTLRGEPISPAYNVDPPADQFGPVKSSPGILRPSSTADCAASTSGRSAHYSQQLASQPSSAKTAAAVKQHSPEEKRDGASPLGDLDFSGLAGMNVFKKKGASAQKSQTAPSKVSADVSQSEATHIEGQQTVKQDTEISVQQPLSDQIPAEDGMQAEPDQTERHGNTEPSSRAANKPDQHNQRDKAAEGSIIPSPDQQTQQADRPHAEDEDVKILEAGIDDPVASKPLHDSSTSHRDEQSGSAAAGSSEGRKAVLPMPGSAGQEEKPNPEGVLAAEPTPGFNEKPESNNQMPLQLSGPNALADNAQVPAID